MRVYEGVQLRVQLRAHCVADNCTVRILISVPGPLGRGRVVQRQHAVPEARLPERGPGLGSHIVASLSRTMIEQALGRLALGGACCAAAATVSPSPPQQSACGHFRGHDESGCGHGTAPLTCCGVEMTPFLVRHNKGTIFTLRGQEAAPQTNDSHLVRLAGVIAGTLLVAAVADDKVYRRALINLHRKRPSLALGRDTS